MVRVPSEISRTVELRCGFVGEDGRTHLTVEIAPLTMLESLRMEGEAAHVPEDLSEIMDSGTWSTLCRTAAMVRRLGDIPEASVSARLLLDLQEIDAIYLAQQCKEVSLAAAGFRGGSRGPESGNLPAGDADRVV